MQVIVVYALFLLALWVEHVSTLPYFALIASSAILMGLRIIFVKIVLMDLHYTMENAIVKFAIFLAVYLATIKITKLVVLNANKD